MSDGHTDTDPRQAGLEPTWDGGRCLGEEEEGYHNDALNGRQVRADEILPVYVEGSDMLWGVCVVFPQSY